MPRLALSQLAVSVLGGPSSVDLVIALKLNGTVNFATLNAPFDSFDSFTSSYLFTGGYAYLYQQATAAYGGMECIVQKRQNGGNKAQLAKFAFSASDPSGTLTPLTVYGSPSDCVFVPTDSVECYPISVMAKDNGPVFAEGLTVALFFTSV